MNKINQEQFRTNRFTFALQLGFFAGFFWGGARLLMYGLRFTKVIPGFLAEPFFKHDFLLKPAGHMIGYLLFIVLSIIASLIYVFAFRKLKGPFPGMVYGILWWAGLLYGGAKLFLLQPPFRLPWNTVISEFCLYLLWGLFIGYTAAMEYTDERKREQKPLFS